MLVSHYNTNHMNHLQNITDSMNSGTQLDVLYTDFLKAFDRVQFFILLIKLWKLGLSRQLMLLFLTYICGRTQVVRGDGCFSKPFIVNSGVGQVTKYL